MATGKSAGRVSVRVWPDSTGFREELKAKLDKIERGLKVQVDAVFDDGALNRQLDQLKNKLDGYKVEVKADLDAKLAKTQMAALARTRTADVVVKVNKASLAATGAALARLSGARVASDSVRSLGESLSNLDRNVPKLAALGLVIANLGSAALASLSGVLGLGAGLAQVAGAAVVLPAVLAGGAVSMVTLALALKDTKDRLSELKEPLQNFQKSISGKFWGQAEAPIKRLAGNLLPLLQKSMGRVSAELGSFAGRIADAFNGSRLQLPGMMSKLADSIKIASAAVRPLVNAFMALGTVGSQYLPRMASALVALSRQFSNFVLNAQKDGSLQRWAENGIGALKALGSVVGSAASILSGLFKAASAAGGGSGLTAFAGNLNAIAKIINGPAFQGALTTLFRGALAAMSGLGAALKPIGSMITALAPALAQVMATAGQAVGGLLSAVASALSSPVFATGLTQFFSGIAAGLKAIQPAIPAVVTALAALGSVAGTIATNLGTVLGAALRALAPVVVAVAQAVQPLVPILGQALVAAITTLAPALQMLVVALGRGLATIIPALVPIVSQLAVTFSQILTALIPVIPPILQLVAAFLTGLLPAVVALTPVLTQLATSIASVLVTAVTAIVPLIPQLAAAWLQVTQAIIPLVPLISQFLQAIIPIIPPIIQAAATSSILAAALVGGLVRAFVAVVQRILAFSATVRSMAANLSGATAIVISRLAAMASAFLSAFSRARAAVSSAMASITGTVTGNITRAAGAISSGVARIRSAISSGFSAAASLVSSAMSRIRSVVASVVSAVISRIASWMSTTVARIRSGFSSAVSAVSSAMSRIASAVSSGISRAVSLIHSLPGRARAALGNLGGALYGAGSSLVSGFVNGIRGAIGRVAAAAASAARAAVNAAKSALHINSPSRVFRDEIGAQISAGMALGILDEKRQVTAATSSLIDLRNFQVPRADDYAANLGGIGSSGGGRSYFEGANFYGYTPRQMVQEVRAMDATDQILYGSGG